MQPEAPSLCDVHWSWGKFPQNRIDGTRMVVPLGLLYTPLHGQCLQLPCEPVRCGCGACLNPHSLVDHRSKTWGCVMCNARNPLPLHYANLPDHQVPVELDRQNETVEYLLSTAPGATLPTIALVVDTCLTAECELQALKEYLLLVLNKIPENFNVCLITYGATVQLHDLSGSTDFGRCAVFRGSLEATPSSVKQQVVSIEKYVRCLSDADLILTSLVEDLPADFWPFTKDMRPLRCTGAALSVAASVLTLPPFAAPGSIIMLFTSGVCTEGPGMLVEQSRTCMIRSHTDLRDNAAPAKFVSSVTSYYDSLMRRLVQAGHSMSFFAASLDQTGFAEMKLCVQATGGVAVVEESWAKPCTKASLGRYLSRSTDMLLALGFNMIMDVATSPTLKVAGVIGPCIGTGKNSQCVSETEIGMGGTCQWTTCAIDVGSTFAVFFETAAAPPTATEKSNFRYAQIQTKYMTPAGITRLRVTTLSHAVQHQTNFAELAQSFDQQTAAVLLARIAVYKTDTSSLFDVLRWVDRHLIRLVSRFGEYTRDQPQTLKLLPQFSLFPAFIYHFRRSAFLNVFNSSPDETAVLRFILQRATCDEAIVMIQPTLFSYTLQAPPQPVPLDAQSVLCDNVLLLDTFFEILIHYGETVAAWRNAGYHELPEYEYFKEFLEQVKSDALELTKNRFPAPRLVEAAKNEPDARILYNRINPSNSRNNPNGYGGGAEELVNTDDASLQVFMEHLKKLAVQA